MSAEVQEHVGCTEMKVLPVIDPMDRSQHIVDPVTGRRSFSGRFSEQLISGEHMDAEFDIDLSGTILRLSVRKDGAERIERIDLTGDWMVAWIENCIAVLDGGGPA